MAVYRVNPRVIGTYDFWTLTAGSSKVQAVNQTDDGDTSVITDTGGNKQQSFFMNQVTGVMASIASIEISGKAKRTTAGTGSLTSHGIKQGATDTYLSSIGTTTSYVLTTAAPRTTSATGAAWTPAIVDLTEAVIFSQTTDDAPVFFVTLMYWDITGDLVSGGFSYIIGSRLGPFIAIGLHEIGKLAAHLYRVSGIRIEPHELLRAWRELRDDRHPVIFDLRRA